jgi:hypothetical protein
MQELYTKSFPSSKEAENYSFLLAQQNGINTPYHIVIENQVFVLPTDELDEEDDLLVEEQRGSDHAVFTFGRMNPPTAGHEKLVNKVREHAKEHSADPHVYLSHSSDPKKNPLQYKDKVKYARHAFGSIVKDAPHRHVIDVLKHLHSQGYQHATAVVGSDRKDEFHKLIHKYNGKEYNFKSIHVVSAGDRDPDAEGVEGMSASKMRDAASKNDHSKFKSGLPSNLHKHAHTVMKLVRKGMNINEEIENVLAEEYKALTPKQRIQHRIVMQRFRPKLNARRNMMRRQLASLNVIKRRSARQARNIMRVKLASTRGKNYSKLPYSSRSAIDQLLANKQKLIQNIARKLVIPNKQKEMKRFNARIHAHESLEILIPEAMEAPAMSTTTKLFKHRKLALKQRFRDD